MPELRRRVVDLDVQRLRAIDPRDDSEVWLRALTEQSFPTQFEGPEGSPQALIAQLYEGAWTLSELEPVLRKGRVPLTLTFVGPAWTWAIPVMIWALAFLVSLLRDSMEERLLTFARVWAAAFWGAAALLAWMAWLNVKARRQQRGDAELAKERRAEVIEELVAARARLTGLPFVARLPKHTLVHNPELVELREALRRSPPTAHPPLLARRDTLRAEVEALVARLEAEPERLWLPIPRAEAG